MTPSRPGATLKPGPMADDERDLEAALRAAKTLLAEREAEDAALQARLGHARRVLEELSRHRKRGRVDMLDSAQRGAVRTVLLAVGSATLIAGATALDASLGGAAIVASFAVLVFEGVR